MNKKDLILAVSEKTGQTQKCTAQVIDAALECITDTVAKGDSVTLRGFGVFDARKRAARTVMNLHTKEPIRYPETVVPYFKPGTELKNAVKE